MNDDHTEDPCCCPEDPPARNINESDRGDGETDKANTVDEAHAIEILSRSFEHHVRTYQDTWLQTWQEEIAAYEQNVKAYEQGVVRWQHTLQHPFLTTPAKPTIKKPSKA